jgi:hypothetical protein
MSNNNIHYTWKFNDEKNRGTLWYIITLSIVIWLVIWWFLTKQYWMSFIVLLIAWLTYFIENNSPEQIEVNISELWIKIWNSFYDYSKIDSYTFIYTWENANVLRLHFNKKWLRYIDLPITNNLVSDLKWILSDFIEENSKGELSFSEKLIKILKL